MWEPWFFQRQTHKHTHLALGSECVIWRKYLFYGWQECVAWHFNCLVPSIYYVANILQFFQQLLRFRIWPSSIILILIISFLLLLLLLRRLILPGVFRSKLSLDIRSAPSKWKNGKIQFKMSNNKMKKRKKEKKKRKHMNIHITYFSVHDLHECRPPFPTSIWYSWLVRDHY